MDDPQAANDSTEQAQEPSGFGEDGSQRAVGSEAPVDGEREPPIQDKQRDAAIEDLERAEVLDESSSQDFRNLAARAYVRTGGVPARIVNPGQSEPVPDLTTERDGPEVLKRLDESVGAQIVELNKRKAAAEKTNGRVPGDQTPG